MGTKSIDTIQTEQIDLLENDINELKTKLNLLVDDITRPLNSELGAGAAAIVNSIINNINNIFNCLSGVTAVGNLGKYTNNNSDNPATPRPTDGILKRLTEIDDLYTQHISRKFPPLIDIVSVPRVGYADLIHTHPEGWVASDGTCLTATVTNNNLPSSYWGTSITGITMIPYDVAGLIYGTNWDGTHDNSWAGCTVAIDSSGNVTSADFDHPFFGGIHEGNSYGYDWSVDDEMMSTWGSSGGASNAAFHGTVTSTGSQIYEVPETNAGVLRSPERNASSGHGDDAPDVGGPVAQAIQAGGETSTGAILESSAVMHPDVASTTVVNASVDANYPTTTANVFFLEDGKKADIARAKKLARKTLNTLRSI